MHRISCRISGHTTDILIACKNRHNGNIRCNCGVALQIIHFLLFPYLPASVTEHCKAGDGEIKDLDC